MALIKCPECGEKISDKSNMCIHCGYPLEKFVEKLSKEYIANDVMLENNVSAGNNQRNDEKNDMANSRETDMSKLLPKLIFVFSGVLLAIIITVIVTQRINENKRQQSFVRFAIEDYEVGNYVDAMKNYDEVENKGNLGEYSEKILFMNKVQEYINEIEKYTPTGSYENMYIGDKVAQDLAIANLLCYSIGQYGIAESLGCDERLFTIMEQYAELYVNYNNITIKKLLNNCKSESNDNRELFFPLLGEDEDKVNLIIEQLDNGLDYATAEKNFNQYINKRTENQQAEYNASHPVQVSNDDCKITHSRGYYYCNGTVHNVSGSTYYYVKVKVTYYDKDDKVLTTDWTYAVSSEGIKGGENQQFEIMTKVDSSPEKFKVEILEYD